MDSDSEGEYWRSVSPLDPSDFSATDTDVEEPPTGVTVKTPVKPVKPLPEPRDDDTPRSRRTAAGPSRQAQAAPSPTKTLSQSMRNLAITPSTTAKGNQPSTSSAQLTPPDFPIMPGALLKTPIQPSIALCDENDTPAEAAPRGLSQTASGFLPYPSLSPEMRAQASKPEKGALFPAPSFHWDAESAPSPTSTVSFLPSRDTLDVYDDLLRDAFAGVEKGFIAHHRKVKHLDKRRVAYGVQLELARGV